MHYCKDIIFSYSSSGTGTVLIAVDTSTYQFIVLELYSLFLKPRYQTVRFKFASHLSNRDSMCRSRKLCFIRARHFQDAKLDYCCKFKAGLVIIIINKKKKQQKMSNLQL